MRLLFHELELLRPYARLHGTLFTLKAAEPEVLPLGGLVAARHLGELATVTDAKGPGLLPGDPRQMGFSSLLDLLHLVHGMSLTMRTVRLILFRHLHKIFTFLRWDLNDYPLNLAGFPGEWRRFYYTAPARSPSGGRPRLRWIIGIAAHRPR